jgi:hypothetical protein
MKRKVLTWAIVVFACLGVVVTRAIVEGRRALSAGDDALVDGDTDEAIAQWRRAARWYVPLAPHVGDAYDRLEQLARDAEARGDRDTALAAWEGIRGSIKATRSFYTPHSDRLEPANRRIAALRAATPEDARAAPDQTEAQRTAWHYDLLARDDGPSLGWSILALLGFATWIGGGLLFALRGITPEDRLVRRTAAIAGIAVAAGLLVWMTGLYYA